MSLSCFIFSLCFISSFSFAAESDDSVQNRSALDCVRAEVNSREGLGSFSMRSVFREEEVSQANEQVLRCLVGSCPSSERVWFAAPGVGIRLRNFLCPELESLRALSDEELSQELQDVREWPAVRAEPYVKELLFREGKPHDGRVVALQEGRERCYACISPESFERLAVRHNIMQPVPDVTDRLEEAESACVLVGNGFHKSRRLFLELLGGGAIPRRSAHDFFNEYSFLYNGLKLSCFLGLNTGTECFRERLLQNICRSRNLSRDYHELVAFKDRYYVLSQEARDRLVNSEELEGEDRAVVPDVTECLQGVVEEQGLPLSDRDLEIYLNRLCFGTIYIEDSFSGELWFNFLRLSDALELNDGSHYFHDKLLKCKRYQGFFIPGQFRGKLVFFDKSIADEDGIQALLLPDVTDLIEARLNDPALGNHVHVASKMAIEKEYLDRDPWRSRRRWASESFQEKLHRLVPGERFIPCRYIKIYEALGMTHHARAIAVEAETENGPMPEDMDHYAWGGYIDFLASGLVGYKEYLFRFSKPVIDRMRGEGEVSLVYDLTGRLEALGFSEECILYYLKSLNQEPRGRFWFCGPNNIKHLPSEYSDQALLDRIELSYALGLEEDATCCFNEIDRRKRDEFCVCRGTYWEVPYRGLIRFGDERFLVPMDKFRDCGGIGYQPLVLDGRFGNSDLSDEQVCETLGLLSRSLNNLTDEQKASRERLFDGLGSSNA